MGDAARRDDLRSFASVAQEAERWEDMAAAMRALAQETSELAREEQYLLSLAYKNLIQPIRNAWHTIAAVQLAPIKGGDASSPGCGSLAASRQEACIRRYREKLEAEVQGMCEEVFALLQPLKASPKQNTETLVFLHKMTGDYYRYMAEVTSGSVRARAEAGATTSYDTALALAKKVLAGSSPLRLGVALNYSVFCSLLLERPAEAIAIAQAAVDAAEVGLTGLSREDRHESGTVRRVLLTNIREWQASLLIGARPVEAAATTSTANGVAATATATATLQSPGKEQRRWLQALTSSWPAAAENEASTSAEATVTTTSATTASVSDDHTWRCRDYDGIDILPPSLADLIELGE